MEWRKKRRKYQFGGAARTSGGHWRGREIPSLRNLFLSVVRFNPKHAAAPIGPLMTKSDRRRTCKIWSCSTASKLASPISKATSLFAVITDFNSTGGSSSMRPRVKTPPFTVSIHPVKASERNSTLWVITKSNNVGEHVIAVGR